jgi:alpha-beta hydrolase superfamily lysophospholipase
MHVPAVKKVAGRIASRVAPRLSLPNGLRGSDMTHDPVVARDHDQDPLCFHNATARWFRESTKAQARALARAPQLTVPLYVLFGTADPIAKLAAGKAFYERAGSPDKTCDERPGLFHEDLMELEWRDLAAKLRDWMLAHA